MTLLWISLSILTAYIAIGLILWAITRRSSIDRIGICLSVIQGGSYESRPAQAQILA